MKKIKNAEKPLSVIHFNDEIKYLKERLRLENNGWGLIGKWADMSGCHRPQFSNILAEKAILTMEQAYRLAKGLGLNDVQSEYFLLLVERRRTNLLDYHEHIEKKLRKIREDNERLELRLDRRQSLPSSAPSIYYSAWYWSAVHISTSIPELQNPEVLAYKLGLSIDFILQILHQLSEWGLVFRQSEDRWTWSSGEMHAPKNSPLSALHQNNWRIKAVENAQFFKPQSVHFTGVYSMDKETFLGLKELLINYIEVYNQKAGEAPAEMTVCFNADLFQVSSPLETTTIV